MKINIEFEGGELLSLSFEGTRGDFYELGGFFVMCAEKLPSTVVDKNTLCVSMKSINEYTEHFKHEKYNICASLAPREK